MSVLILFGRNGGVGVASNIRCLAHHQHQSTQHRAAQPQLLPRTSTMKPVDKISAATFAPSPLLSADTSASDCEIDALSVPSADVGRGQTSPPRGRRDNRVGAGRRAGTSTGLIGSSRPSQRASYLTTCRPLSGTSSTWRHHNTLSFLDA
jgi:hypothetical protein